MVLARFWSYLPTMLVMNGCYMTCDITMVIYRREDLKVFLEAFYKCSWACINVLIITIHPATPGPVYHPTFIVMKSLSSWAMRLLMVWPPLKYTWPHVLPRLSWNFHSVLDCMGQLWESFSSYNQVSFNSVNYYCCYYCCSQDLANDCSWVMRNLHSQRYQSFYWSYLLFFSRFG